MCIQRNAAHIKETAMVEKGAHIAPLARHCTNISLYTAVWLNRPWKWVVVVVGHFRCCCPSTLLSLSLVLFSFLEITARHDPIPLLGEDKPIGICWSTRYSTINTFSVEQRQIVIDHSAKITLTHTKWQVRLLRNDLRNLKTHVEDIGNRLPGVNLSLVNKVKIESKNSPSVNKRKKTLFIVIYFYVCAINRPIWPMTFGLFWTVI